MTIKDKINADYIEAFKEKNSVKKNLLSVIKGEIQTVEKNTNSPSLSDDEVIKILNKTAKSLKENLRALAPTDQSESLGQTVFELAIVECYLPKQLSESEVQEKINSLIGSGVNSIGALMKEFTNLPVDKKMVSELIKKSLV
jgi:uncharacterized protein YqeY